MAARSFHRPTTILRWRRFHEGRAAPTQDTLLYAGTVDLYRCSLAAGCILRNTTNAADGCAAPAQVAPAQHAIAALATATQPLLYLGNDGGLWRSTRRSEPAGRRPARPMMLPIFRISMAALDHSRRWSASRSILRMRVPASWVSVRTVLPYCRPLPLRPRGRNSRPAKAARGHRSNQSAALVRFD